LKQALLQADQICLSMMQIHVLLCLAKSNVNAEGDVDVAAWAGTCSSVLPHMFDAKCFIATAERLQLEAAELQRQRENAEIAALGAAKVGAKGDGEQEQLKEIEMNQEDVEKILIQLFSSGESRSQSLTPETMFAMLRNNDAPIQTCQLSDYEITGLMADLVADPLGLVVFSDHVKRVVSIIFELRRNQLLNAYLQEGAFEKLGIPRPDFVKLEKIFPLMPPGWKKKEPEKIEVEKEDIPDVGRPSGRVSGRRQTGQARHSGRRVTLERDKEGSRAGSKNEPRTASKQSNHEDDLGAVRAQGRGRLQVGGPILTHRRSSISQKQEKGNSTPSAAAAVHIKDTPNGRGYQRRRAMLDALLE
jgi:hypothetical protein